MEPVMSWLLLIIFSWVKSAWPRRRNLGCPLIESANHHNEHSHEHTRSYIQQHICTTHQIYIYIKVYRIIYNIEYLLNVLCPGFPHIHTRNIIVFFVIIIYTHICICILYIIRLLFFIFMINIPEAYKEYNII